MKKENEMVHLDSLITVEFIVINLTKNKTLASLALLEGVNKYFNGEIVARFNKSFKAQKRQ